MILRFFRYDTKIKPLWLKETFKKDLLPMILRFFRYDTKIKPLWLGNVQKRPFAELSSPSSETEELMMIKIEEPIHRSFRAMMPKNIGALKKNSFK